jgi:hypothetical protein
MIPSASNPPPEPRSEKPVFFIPVKLFTLDFISSVVYSWQLLPARLDADVKDTIRSEATNF